MPGRIQEMPQSWLTASRPVTEIVKQPSTGLVKDSSLNKDIKTEETEQFLEEIDAQMKVICAWEMDSTTVDQCIKEL
ncbi:NleF caspase inhibitor, partial [Yersinia pestis]